MNCCEDLDALGFKWLGWNEASGPRDQPETMRDITRLTQPPIFNPILVRPKIYTVRIVWRVGRSEFEIVKLG